MSEYLDQATLRFIVITALITTGIIIANGVLLFRRRGTAGLQRLSPAIDSTLVAAGFMAFTGTGLALVWVFQQFSFVNYLGISGLIKPLDQMISINQQVIADGNRSYVITAVSGLFTTIMAWFLFFVFFECWYLLRFLQKRFMNQLANTPEHI